jgi:hypothetical protein
MVERFLCWAWGVNGMAMSFYLDKIQGGDWEGFYFKVNPDALEHEASAVMDNNTPDDTECPLNEWNAKVDALLAEMRQYGESSE